MELRDIEIFLALAEELHFGRTAERLRVTPARVSQSIKKQERRLGAALFDRTTRSVTLTAVGQQLFDELRPHYRGMHESLERATNAARGKTEVLRLSMIASNLDDLSAGTGPFPRHPPGVWAADHAQSLQRSVRAAAPRRDRPASHLAAR